MDNKLEVEVTLENGFVYKAFVEDLRPNELEVSFEKNWKRPILIEFQKVRFPPENSDVGLKVKDLVEVRQNDNRYKISYWRKAIFTELDINTGRYIVEFIGRLNGTENAKFKPSDIRPINEKPSIGRSTLDKVEFEIPIKLRNVAKDPNIHNSFRKQVEADICNYIPEKNILRLISRSGGLTRRRVDLLKQIHLHHLEDELKHSPATSSVNSNFCEEFEISEDLMGLALGKRYTNVKEARKIKDVTNVELIENTLRIQVCGRTPEAVKNARNMLEFSKYHTTIPRNLAEEILEDDGKIIEDIVEQSGLVRIESGDDDEESDENPDYPIVFIGNPPCIENAKVLLEYQLKLLERNLKKKETGTSNTSSETVPPVVDPNLVVERVPIRKDLKGLAIGKNYENVKKAEKIPGVVKIEIPSQMPMLIIHAENEEAARAARRLLEYDEDTVEIEQASLGKIIGKNGVTIKKIESSSEGVRVHIPSRVKPSDLSGNGKVIIRVCGPAHSIPATIELIKTAESLGHL